MRIPSSGENGLMSELPSPQSELLEALYRGDRDAVEAKLAEQPDLTLFEAAAVGDAGRVRELLSLEPAPSAAGRPTGSPRSISRRSSGTKRSPRQSFSSAAPT